MPNIASSKTFTVTAISKQSGARKVMGRNLGAFRATKLANAVKAKGFDAEVKQGKVVYVLTD
jgi:hypothetical protein